MGSTDNNECELCKDYYGDALCPYCGDWEHERDDGEDYYLVPDEDD